jgi:hypothetical protein
MADVRISDLTTELDLGNVKGLVGYVESATPNVFNTVKITGDPLNSSKNLVVYNSSSDIPTSGGPASNIHRTELSKDGIKTFGSNLKLESSSLVNIDSYGSSMVSTGDYNNVGDAISIVTSNSNVNKGAIAISSNGTHSDNKGIKLRSGTNIQIDLHSNGGASAPAVGYVLKAKDVEGNVEWGVMGEAVTALTLQGTSETSTSRASYGVNVITTATTANLATRLPDPVTGQQVTFINNSLIPISVFPSTTGGKINNRVDGQASIPNDGRSYTFYCVENPTPGAWVWSPPATNQLEYQEMSISHTNGTASDDFNAGQGGSNDSSVGIGFANGITTTGTLNTYNFSATATKFKCYTNIRWADIVSGGIQGAWWQGYGLLNSGGNQGTTQGQKITMQFSGTQAFPGSNVQEITVGPVYTGEVGDMGTLYMEAPSYGYPLWRILGNQAVATPIAGNNETMNSQAFTTFGMFPSANAATKVYKYKWFIEYSS